MSSNRKAQILTVIAAPHWGGLHTVVERTTSFYKEMGYERIVSLPRVSESQKKRLELSGCTVVFRDFVRPRKSLNPVHHFRFIARFWSDVKFIKNCAAQYGVDCIEVAGLLNLQPLVAARISRTPMIYQLHSTLAPGFVRKALARYFGKRAQVIMTSGHGMIRKHGGLENISTPVIPFCAPLDLNKFRQNPIARSAIRSQLNIAEDALVIGTLGNKGWQKRHDWIVNIANSSSNKGLIFIISGNELRGSDRYYQRSVLDKIKNLKLQDRVRVVEQKWPANELMSSFDIFILPSIAEGASLVTAEAMAVGLPIIASDVGSISDIVDQANGYLCDPYSLSDFTAAVASLENAKTREQLGIASKNKARSLVSDRQCAAAHFEAYDIAIHRGGHLKG